MHQGDFKAITVAVPTHNRSVLLVKTIESLTPVKDLLNLIVINDGGSIPADLPSWVTLINLPENHGEAHAVNVAWSHCQTPFFAVISDDDPQPEDWLGPILRFASENPDYVAYFPNTCVIRDSAAHFTVRALQYDKIRFHRLLRSPCLAGVLINARFLKELGIRNLRVDGLIFPNDLIQWLNLSLVGDFVAVPMSTAYWWVHDLQGSNRIPSELQATLYHQHVGNWILQNVDRGILCQSYLACLLRSIQLTHQKSRSRRLILKLSRSTLCTLRANGYSYFTIGISLIDVIFSLIGLKSKNA